MVLSREPVHRSIWSGKERTVKFFKYEDGQIKTPIRVNYAVNFATVVGIVHYYYKVYGEPIKADRKVISEQIRDWYTMNGTNQVDGLMDGCSDDLREQIENIVLEAFPNFKV
jgi:hypothetical protein